MYQLMAFNTERHLTFISFFVHTCTSIIVSRRTVSEVKYDLWPQFEMFSLRIFAKIVQLIEIGNFSRQS